jgi:hypothetical protein
MSFAAKREKSSQTSRIHFGCLRDEKNRQVCLISRRHK